MTKDEALKLALEALERLDGWLALRYGSGLTPEEKQTVTAIKEVLAQPEQEPVAFASHGVVNWIADKQFQHEALLYSAPQRTWVGLTDEEIEQMGLSNYIKVVRETEAALKVKNT